ncbi:MAG TPA: hypothetical protein VGK59_21960 [Ohtaekwangia sp.]
MRTWKVSLAILMAGAVMSLAFSFRKEVRPKKNYAPFVPPKGCVFRTLMGEESADSSFRFKTPDKVVVSMDRGLAWIAKAQNAKGGWGAGSHYHQQEMDPHAVPADPATTSMVAMAILRSGNTLTQGTYALQLRKALYYLLETVETSSPNSSTITTETNTQIQTKLGVNIDVILTAQFLSNIIDYVQHDAALKSRIKRSLDTCVQKIQQNQQEDGSTSGAGWAGVLQSSLANNALETAQSKGAAVDDGALEKSRTYQKSNYDARTGEAKTDMGAGIVLYSVTGSARASAKEARKVKEEMEAAKKERRLPQSAPASAENLQKIGYDRDKALKYSTAYEVYESAKVQAQREDVMDGFGSNGGEEFLSYLQTGESMIINKDNTWQKWYDNISGRMINIQNNDGSWNGHHCITSPVFCTATCLLILSVNNDVDKLVELGK